MKEPRKYLIGRGWWCHNGLWHNLALSFGWPTKDAVRLEREAAAGDERVRRLLKVMA